MNCKIVLKILAPQFFRIPQVVSCAIILLLSAPVLPKEAPDASFVALLNTQVEKHPLMQIQDVYKLIYQSAFGNSHLLIDPERARRHLDRELAGIRGRDVPLLENISPDSSLVRVNLCAFRYRRLDRDLLFEAMLKSAGRSREASELFRKRWHEFVKMVELKKLPFNPERVKVFETRYLAEPREMHHSKIYTNAYNPHYRVVRRDALKRILPGAFR